MRFLVTTGPTREAIDAVRFISNPSTGRMGFAVAKAAAAAGHEAVVVAGPGTAPPPDGVEVERVVSTQEMLDACLKHLPRADVFVAAAAPCDYRPVRALGTKLKKSAGSINLLLEPTPDILLEVSRRKEARVLIGFALEVQDARANALEKLLRKGLDAIVLNSPRAFGAEASSVVLLRRGGAEENLGEIAKDDLGRRLVALAEDIRGERDA